MDVARLVAERAAEVAAFATAVFRAPDVTSSDTVQGDGAAHSAAGATPSPSPSTVTSRAPRYRRPSSGNVPVSQVVRVERERAKRARSRGHDTGTTDAREAAKLHVHRDHCMPSGEEGGDGESTSVAAARDKRSLVRLRIKQYHRHVLPAKPWQRLLKRRRRLWQRRRPTAVRRHCQRRVSLRNGKTVTPCRCVAPSRARAVAQHTACTWLPSHARLVSRFHMRVQRITLPPRGAVHVEGYGSDKAVTVRTKTSHASASSRDALVPAQTTPRARAEENVRIAVPDVSRRKHHRRLQRWCSQLAKPLSPSARSTAPPPRAPPAYLLADTSHTCVYTLHPDYTGPPADVLKWVTAALQLVPSCPDQPCQAARQWTRCPALGDKAVNTPRPSPHDALVVHGHMWATKSRLSVPVSLLLSCSTAPEKAGVATLYLVAASPLQFRTPTRQQLRIRLVSLWTPCGAVDRFACSWEWWSPTSVPSESAAVLNRLVASALKRATRRSFTTHSGAADEMAATTMSGGQRPHKRKATNATVTSSPLSVCGSALIADQYGYDVFVCPAWARVDSGESGVRSVAACTILLVQRTDCGATRRDSARRSCLARRCLFRAARLFLGALLEARRLLCVAPLTARAYQMRVQLIGREDRCTLRHLLGRASFPQDFRPHAITAKRKMPSWRGTRVWQSTLLTHGSPSNSDARTLVGSSRADRRLSTAHAQPGCLLVRLQWTSVAGAGAVVRVVKIGVVTSGPFFVHRLGRAVALVWCVYPHGTESLVSQDGGALLALISPDALETAERQTQDASELVKRRRIERRRERHPRATGCPPATTAACGTEPAGALLPYIHVSQTLLNESVCSFVTCFPIYV